MNSNYSFLQDELALIEIRKHQWIESEKQGREIGFATASLDWIKKYGQEWKQFRLALKQSDNTFSEKRRYRRFYYNFPLQIKTIHNCIESHTKDINLVGLSCRIPVSLADNTEAEITLNLPNNTRPKSVRFKTRVLRVSSHAAQDKSYDIFLPFSENLRDLLRINTQLFTLQ